MAIEIKNDANASTVRDNRYFTGVIPYRVILINPTLDELHEKGLTYIKKEPEYQKEADFGNGPIRTTQVDFWLKSVPTPECDYDITTKVTFQIAKNVYVGKTTGKTQYVNRYGRMAWASNELELNSNPYFLNEDARPAYKGEEELYKFLFAWLNMSYDPDRKILTDCRVDVEKLFDGDFSELKELVTVGEPYIVRVLTGVRRVEDEENGSIKYFQVTYSKYFLKHNQKITTSLQKYLESNEYNSFGTETNPVIYTFAIKEFDPSAQPDKEPESKEKANNPF